MVKDFTTYINEGLFDRNQSEFAIRKTGKGIEQIYIPKTKKELYEYIEIDIEQAKKEGTYPNVNLNNIDVSELESNDLSFLFSEYCISPEISSWDLKTIPYKFFYGNISIKDFTIPDSVTYIGDFAFSLCPNLTSVTIGNRVKRIRKHAFYNCSSLTSVTIPNGVISIGVETFTHCSSLTSITISNSVKSIGEDAFTHCSSLTSIVVENGNSVYDSRNDCNAVIEKSTNELIVGCQRTIIPNSVTSIGSGAFEGCTGLTYVTIPNSVTSIGSYSFFGCSSLTSVEIPDSVTSIGYDSFAYCSGLKSVTIPKQCDIESNSFPKNCKITKRDD